MLTVAVVDDHPALRLGIIGILKQIPDIEVIGEAGSGTELTALLEDGAPDVLLLDISMPEFDVFQAIPRMQKKHRGMRIIIVTIHDDEKHVCRLVELGVDGYLVKEEPMPEYTKAIHAVAAGGTYFSQRIIPVMVSNPNQSTPELTLRELEVLDLIATGASTAEVAEKLFITSRTVTTHISNMYRKLEVNNRTAVVRKAIELGLISV